MGRPGFEPGTNRLKAEYSTVELATRFSCFLQPRHYSISVCRFVKGFRKNLLRDEKLLSGKLQVQALSAFHLC
jgi:hypothetical protein